MKRRILLVDDEVAVLLTLKAVLEISGFDVDTAASAREGKSKLHTREYHMVITDMRMENDEAGIEVIKAARAAAYHPAIAMLTAFPIAEEDWQDLGADKMLVKPMHTRVLLQQIENLLTSHEAKLSIWSTPAPRPPVPATAAKPAAAGSGAKKTAVARRPPVKRVVRKASAKKSVGGKSAATKAGVKAAKKR
jgi:DNA-binding response OmpR family regulator